MICQAQGTQTTEIKEFLTSLIGNAPIGILAFDLQLRCILANSWAAEVFGASPEQMVDCHFNQLLQNWLEFKVRLTDSELGGKLNFDFHAVEHEDHVYDVSCRIMVNGVLITIHDITEQTRIREEQLQLVNRLKLANSGLADFAYICAHDMKSPVSNLMGLIELMENCEGLEGEAKTLFQMFKHSTQGLDRKIRSLNDMLTFKQTLNEIQQQEDSSLRTVINDVVTSLQQDLDASCATIDFDETEDVRLQISETHLHSIFHNLISNAVKFRIAERKPEIQIRSLCIDRNNIIEITDNGMGFDSKLNGNKLFGLFNRLHTHVEGTGVGLYLVKSIMESYGGQVAVDSVENVGTTFRLELPYAK